MERHTPSPIVGHDFQLWKPYFLGEERWAVILEYYAASLRRPLSGPLRSLVRSAEWGVVPPSAVCGIRRPSRRPAHCSNSRFSTILMRCRFVVATSVACYAAPTTEVVTTNAITGIAALTARLHARAASLRWPKKGRSARWSASPNEGRSPRRPFAAGPEPLAWRAESAGPAGVPLTARLPVWAASLRWPCAV